MSGNLKPYKHKQAVFFVSVHICLTPFVLHFLCNARTMGGLYYGAAYFTALLPYPVLPYLQCIGEYRGLRSESNVERVFPPSSGSSVTMSEKMYVPLMGSGHTMDSVCVQRGWYSPSQQPYTGQATIEGKTCRSLAALFLFLPTVPHESCTQRDLAAAALPPNSGCCSCSSMLSLIISKTPEHGSVHAGNGTTKKGMAKRGRGGGPAYS